MEDTPALHTKDLSTNEKKHMANDQNINNLKVDKTVDNTGLIGDVTVLSSPDIVLKLIRSVKILTEFLNKRSELFSVLIFSFHYILNI